MFESFGFSKSAIAAWIEMLDGFNAGWLEFEGNKNLRAVGEEPLETTLRALALNI